MGRTKALLPIGDKVLLTHVVDTCRAASITRIVVVVGAERDEGTLLSRERARTFVHDVTLVVGAPSQTPIDSLRRGLTHVAPGHACLLWPVDHPFADAPLLHAMHAALESGHIVLP